MELWLRGFRLCFLAGHCGGLEGPCRLQRQARKALGRGCPQTLEQGLRRPLAMSHCSSKPTGRGEVDCQASEESVGFLFRGGRRRFLCLAEDFFCHRPPTSAPLRPRAGQRQQLWKRALLFRGQEIKDQKMQGETLRTLRWLSRSSGGFFARPETTTVCVLAREWSSYNGGCVGLTLNTETMSFYNNYEIR